MKKLIIRSVSLIFIIATIIFISDTNAERTASNNIRSYGIIVDQLNVPYSYGEVRGYPDDGEPPFSCTFVPGQTSCTLYVPGSYTLDIFSCAGGYTGERLNFTVISDTTISIYLNQGTCPF